MAANRPVIGNYGKVLTGHSTVWDHKTICDKIEGGHWVQVKTPNISVSWDFDGHLCCQQTFYDPTTDIAYRGHFTDDGVTTVKVPLSDIRRYADFATGEVRLDYWGAITTWKAITLTPEEKSARRIRRLRQVIKSRCFPGIVIKPTRTPLSTHCDEREQRARETLRRVIGESQWASLVRKGFITVRGKSGRYYQIFPDHHFTKVYENGMCIERLCVVLRGNFPPTDSLIMRYLLILNDEKDFWKRAVKHGPGFTQRNREVEFVSFGNYYANPTLPLTEVAKRIQVA